NMQVCRRSAGDSHMVLETYPSVRAHEVSSGLVRRNHGFGDILVRLKWNAWGNDGGPTALGVMPYVKLPTNQDNLGNHSVEGGVIIPFAADLAAGWSVGLMTQFDLVRDDPGNGRHLQLLNSITFDHNLIGNLTA